MSKYKDKLNKQLQIAKTLTELEIELYNTKDKLEVKLKQKHNDIRMLDFLEEMIKLGHPVPAQNRIVTEIKDRWRL